MDMSQYKDMFLSETSELLNSLNQDLVVLEREPQNKEVINQVFRAAHTIKGMAASMSYESIVSLTHFMENILDGIRSGDANLTKDIFTCLFKSIDKIEVILKEIDQTGSTTLNIDLLLDEINHIQSGLGLTSYKVDDSQNSNNQNNDSKQKIDESQSLENDSAYEVFIELNKSCSMPEARSFVIINDLEKLGELYGKKVLQSDQEKNQAYSFKFYINSSSPRKELKDYISLIPDVKRVEIKLSYEKKEDDFFQSSAENSLEESLSDEVVSSLGQIQSTRVPLDKLDDLMNLIGELSINKIRIQQIASFINNPELSESIVHMSRLCTQIQNQMMSVRLIPLDHLFNRFPRMLRDLGVEKEKDFKLTIKGGDIGIDRSIMKDIYEPLLHILRNSLCHGIENESERIQTGKSKEGEISIEASQEKDFVKIIIKDDGRGIDTDKILKLALQKGLVDDSQSLSQSEILMLITAPGFSTADHIDEYSGRGVGMNVVKSKLESIGGSIMIESELGKGSCFILKLPLSMAIINAMLVALKKQTYAIPLSSISETLKISKNEIKKVDNQEVISYREGVLPLLRFNSSGSEDISHDSSEKNKSESLVVLDLGYRKAALVVDDFIGRQEIVVKSLDENMKKMKFFSGATILGSGQVALILDVTNLI